jgi:hypothetical protein
LSKTDPSDTKGRAIPLFQTAGWKPALQAGRFIAPSVYWGEPAFFVRNGEMARGVEIDKCFLIKGIKIFIFLDFYVLPPCVFCFKWRNGEGFEPRIDTNKHKYISWRTQGLKNTGMYRSLGLTTGVVGFKIAAAY